MQNRRLPAPKPVTAARLTGRVPVALAQVAESLYESAALVGHRVDVDDYGALLPCNLKLSAAYPMLWAAQSQRLRQKRPCDPRGGALRVGRQGLRNLLASYL